MELLMDHSVETHPTLGGASGPGGGSAAALGLGPWRLGPHRPRGKSKKRGHRPTNRGISLRRWISPRKKSDFG